MSSIIIVGGRSRTGENNLSMKIAPIPASNQLYIEIEGLNQEGTLTLTDVTGRQLLTQQVDNNGLISLDLSSTQSGLYFVSLREGKAILKTETIIIQK